MIQESKCNILGWIWKKKIKFIFETKNDIFGWLRHQFLKPKFIEKNDFLKTWLFPFAALFFLDFLDLSSLNTRLDLTLIPKVHFHPRSE